MKVLRWPCTLSLFMHVPYVHAKNHIATGLRTVPSLEGLLNRPHLVRNGRSPNPEPWPDPMSLVNNSNLSSNAASSKIAFLFLTRGPMPLEPMWSLFFRSEVMHLAAIYLHPPSAFDCRKAFESDLSPFHGRCLPPKLRVRTAWGSHSLVAAARNLMSFALQDDPSNAYFVLLSDSCVPLWPLNLVHSFLHTTGASWLVHTDHTTPDSRQDLAADVFDETEYQLGTQWYVTARKNISFIFLTPLVSLVSSPLFLHCILPSLCNFFRRPHRFILTRPHAAICANEIDTWRKYRTYCEVWLNTPNYSLAIDSTCAQPFRSKLVLFIPLHRLPGEAPHALLTPLPIVRDRIDSNN